MKKEVSSNGAHYKTCTNTTETNITKIEKSTKN